MVNRSPELQTFLDTLHVSLIANAPPKSPTALAVTKAFAVLQKTAEKTSPCREAPAVCKHLTAAFAIAAASSAQFLATAFQAIEPELCWRSRPDRILVDPNLRDTHANATIIGDGGLEAQSDVRIGVSLLAPNTHYPDHNHLPEEVYVALSPGAWRQADGPWHEPGPGGLIYNPPNIVHSMQSGDTPLLAIWTLPMALA